MTLYIKVLYENLNEMVQYTRFYLPYLQWQPILSNNVYPFAKIIPNFNTVHMKSIELSDALLAEHTLGLENHLRDERM